MVAKSQRGLVCLSFKGRKVGDRLEYDTPIAVSESLSISFMPTVTNLRTTDPRENQSQSPKMCQGNLLVSASCGHPQKFQILQACDCYSSTQDRCNGTVIILHTTTTEYPALCMRCVSRIEANIIREWGLVTAELETCIAETNRDVWAERTHPFNYIASVFERERLREALRRFCEQIQEELMELREMHGICVWSRVADLRDNGC